MGWRWWQPPWGVGRRRIRGVRSSQSSELSCFLVSLSAALALAVAGLPAWRCGACGGGEGARRAPRTDGLQAHLEVEQRRARAPRMPRDGRGGWDLLRRRDTCDRRAWTSRPESNAGGGRGDHERGDAGWGHDSIYFFTCGIFVGTLL
jgi:hypothetical protein